MISLILKYISPYALPVLGVLCVALALSTGILSIQLSRSRAAYSALVAQQATALAANNAAALAQAVAQAQADQAALLAKVQQEKHELQKQLEDVDAILATPQSKNGAVAPVLTDAIDKL